MSRRLTAAIAGEIALTTAIVGSVSRQGESRLDPGTARGSGLTLAISLEPGAKLHRHAQHQHPRPDGRRPGGGVAPGVRRAVPDGLDLGSAFGADQHPGADGVLHVIGTAETVVHRRRSILFVPWVGRHARCCCSCRGAVHAQSGARASAGSPRAAEAFGVGRDIPPIRPEGATEVRQAAAAFNRMQDRIRRFLAQRTEMLAGVSHDLRTPLTRLRLALAMLPKDDALAARRHRNDRRRRGNGADDRRLSRLRARRGDRTGEAHRSLCHAGRCCGRGAPGWGEYRDRRAGRR